MKKTLVAIITVLSGQLLMADALQDALNNQTLVFTTGGDANWFAQSGTTYGGAQAAQSGAIGDSQSTWLKTTVSGVGVLSFKWKVSSESVDWDYATISIDGVEKSRIGGTGGTWSTFCTDILDEDEHEVTWTYCKDSSYASGSDCAWVTDVDWQPITGPISIAFDACGGDVEAKPQGYSFGETYAELPVPTRESCQFIGWFTQKDGGERVEEGDLVRFSVPTLYAHWITKEYVKIIDPKGIFASVDFTDVGIWSIDNSRVRWQMGAEDQGSRVDVLTATFSTERDGVLKFTNDGYGVSVEIDGEYADGVWDGNGYSYAIPDVGEHSLTLYFGYTLSSYYASIKAITVQEAPDSFDVTFDACGGTCAETSRTYDYGSEYGELPTPTLAGCRFLGWSTSEYSDDFVTADDVVLFSFSKLHAQWEVSDVRKFLGEDTGITFTSLTNSSWTLETEYVSGSKVPYLEWRAPSHVEDNVETVLLEAKTEGAGIFQISTILLGNKNLTLTIDGVVQTNYCDASGWLVGTRAYVGAGASRELVRILPTVGEHCVRLTQTDTSDSVDYGYCYMSIGQMSWESAPSSVQVTFDANGGSLLGTTTQTFSVGGIYGTLPVPTRPGCQFAGWYSSKFGGKMYASADYVDWTAEILYAHWTSTIENTLGDSVSNVNVGSSKIYSDGTGVVLPVVESDYGMSYNADNWFEVSCAGEAIISFDWSIDVEEDSDDDYYVSVAPTFSVDGNAVDTRNSQDTKFSFPSYGHEDVYPFRKTVKVFLTPGAHTLRWSVGMCYACNVQVRFAVENFKVEEKPVANRETLFDWGKLAYDYLVWKPNNLSLIQDRYGQRISQNPNDYEARIWRALTKLVRLGENVKAREVIGQFGYAISDYTLKPQGAFVGWEQAPLPNEVVDALSPEIISAIDSALEDVCAIPTDWSGRIEINPDDYGYSIETNSVWTNEKVFIGLAEVSAMRAALEASRAFVKLAQGYDFEADYLSVSNALEGVRSGVHERLSDVMKVAPKVGLVRNLSAMTEAKENFRAALESIKRADAAILNRGDYDTYVFEYDIADATDISECRKLLIQIEASLDATNVIDLTYFAGKYDTNGVVRAQIPGGESIRQLFLGAIFAGCVTKELVPDVQFNPAVLFMDTVKDPTFGGLFPDLGFEELTSIYAGITNKTEDITVPENWLDEIAVAHDKPAGADSYQAAFKAKYGDNLKAALTKPTGKYDLKGNPLYVWQDYVAGTDPLDDEDKFTATITMENGVPVVRWNPELTPAAAALRKYTVYGATALDGKWDDVSDKTDEQRHDLGYQFFSVTVEMK